MPGAIRVRLAAWYAALMLLALSAMAVTVVALVEHSLMQAADDRLGAHHEGLARFANALESGLSPDEVKAEYREYADVSLGNALFALSDARGLILAQPDAAGFADAVATLQRADASTALAPAQISVAGQPYRASQRVFVARGDALRAVIAVPLGPGEAALAQSRRMLWWLLPAMTLLAGGCGYLVSARALRPVDRLTLAAQSIDLQHLQQRLEVPATDDELRRLAMTFNGMLDRLEAGVNNMARFTSEAAHELRTPVARIRVTAELALRRPRQTSDYQDALREIHTESQEMSDLVDDLLTAARADAGMEVPPADLVDVPALVSGWVSRWPFAGTRPELHCESETGVVCGDERQLRRLLQILCENAVKYSAGKRVVLSVSRTQDAVQLDVEDEGIGVATPEQSRVFERFYRSAAARASDVAGSGLGLAIADLIVRRHHATVSVTSPIHPSADAPGTRVRVSFPLAPVPHDNVVR